MKQCFKCGETKDLAAFYHHPRMADGRLNKCKECTKRDTRENYWADRAKHKAYEQGRQKDPRRKALVSLYAKKRHRKAPHKNAARAATKAAIASGQLHPKPCEKCGSTDRVEVHHTDYSRPLEVMWLCFDHHREVHGQKAIAI